MSQLLKALNKAQKEHATAQISNDAAGDHHNSAESVIDPTNSRTLAKSIDLHVIFLGVLIVMVAIGIYFNYNISQNLASTQSRMVGISDSFKAQQANFNKLNGLVAQMDIANNGQRKEFLAKIDKLSAGVEVQIEEVNKLSKAQYSELSKTIEDQQKSIANLTAKYEQLDKSVTNYTDVNSRYTEQLNILKKKIAELNTVEQGQKAVDRK
jgi:hypothetical protein